MLIILISFRLGARRQNVQLNKPQRHFL